MKDNRKETFDRLIKDKAGCIEFAWNGFIRIYEDGEKRCECKGCVADKKMDKENG
jgi:hypothetical protein